METNAGITNRGLMPRGCRWVIPFQNISTRTCSNTLSTTLPTQPLPKTTPISTARHKCPNTPFRKCPGKPAVSTRCRCSSLTPTGTRVLPTQGCLTPTACTRPTTTIALQLSCILIPSTLATLIDLPRMLSSLSQSSIPCSSRRVRSVW
jgi:hypothetical protein